MTTATKPKMTEPTRCPRCNDVLRTTYYEPECWNCGYVQYDYTLPPTAMKKTAVNDGGHYVLRYTGGFPGLKNMLVHVRLERQRNRVVYAVTCPFCKGEMEQSSLSGKRREIREERHKCKAGHRVSLVPNKAGSLGWK